ncbi:hypothetical protein ACOTHT_30680 [Achromobacter xylosoxidans]
MADWLDGDPELPGKPAQLAAMHRLQIAVLAAVARGDLWQPPAFDSAATAPLVA